MPFIDSSWRLSKVAQLFRTGSGTTPHASSPGYFNGGLPWVSSTDVRNGRITSTSRSITTEAVKDFPSLKKHPKGALVIAMYGQGETKGRVGLLGMDAFVNQACCVLTPLGDITSEFAFYWFRTYKGGIVSLALGAGQPNLSQDLVRELRIPVPDLATQHDIVASLAEADRLTDLEKGFLQQRNALLAERRQALITAAVTGQFDVTTGRGADLS